MDYISVTEAAKKWKLSDRTVRQYCKEGRIEGAFLTGKTWNIPSSAEKPARKHKLSNRTLLSILQDECREHAKGGIYHKIQIELTYNSNHMEGSRLTHEETQYIYETNTIGIENKSYNVDDIIETVNHFRCVDYMIQNAGHKLTEKFIKLQHDILKVNTSDSRSDWFWMPKHAGKCSGGAFDRIGDYKKFPNEVGNMETTSPEHVPMEMKKLLFEYNKKEQISIDDILDFHVKFEKIHPFQDGNGRVGRLIMFKECLKNRIVPFIIEDDLKLFYYRGLSQWNQEKGYLTDTCLTCQDRFRKYLEYFRIGD